jgi:hypothetical protein
MCPPCQLMCGKSHVEADSKLQFDLIRRNNR